MLTDLLKGKRTGPVIARLGVFSVPQAVLFLIERHDVFLSVLWRLLSREAIVEGGYCMVEDGREMREDGTVWCRFFIEFVGEDDIGKW